MVTMSREELSEIIDEAVTKALAQQGCTRCSHNDEDHKADHEFIRELMETLRRMNDTKWSVIRALATALTFAILAVAGLKLTWQ